MNTNTKYYTPDIEEFHVGFEFEREILDDDFNHLGWGKETVTIDTNLRNVKKWSNYQRAKYLDREDIESEDWELDSCVEKECFYIHKSSNLENGTIRLVFREKEGSIEINCDKFGECFYGILKNKSELQKLMVQLNIKE